MAIQTTFYHLSLQPAILKASVNDTSNHAKILSSQAFLSLLSPYLPLASRDIPQHGQNTAVSGRQHLRSSIQCWSSSATRLLIH